MRIGQTSFFTFFSEMIASVLGFFATLYVARALGPQGDDVLGIYFVVVAVVVWLRVVGNLGIRTAIKKRLSEGQGRGEYLGAGILLQGTIFVVLSAGLIVAEPLLESYLRGVSVLVVVSLLFANVVLKFVAAIIDGLDLVHVSAFLTPFNRLIRSLTQIAAIFLGFALVGLFAGYAVGAIVAALAGVVYVSPAVSVPTRNHFYDLVSYAKYAWVTSISSRAFGAMDTLVLALFVTDGLIGIYEVSWNLASVLAVFGTSVARSMFPAISELSSDARREEVAGLVTDSLRFAGLFLIPGLVGTAVLGNEVLRIYGPQFSQGGLVLFVLVGARLVAIYQHQFVNALNAIDRPDLAFRVEGLFLVLNLALNLLLVWLYGWVGAAVATATSASVGLLAGYAAVQSVLPITIPLKDMRQQWTAALVMGVAILVGERVLPGTLLASLGLVFAGAGVYGVVMLGISPTLRKVIADNVPALNR